MNRIVLAAALALTLAIAGCAPGATPAPSALSIVTSTDVYASIASAIAGDRADVTAIIDSPAVDPHSYEASARDRLALAEADIVVANGGGYDPFIDALLDDDPLQRVIVAVTLSDVWEGAAARASAPAGASDDHTEHDDHDDHAEHDDHAGDDGHDHDGEVNEHVWYDFDTVKRVASAIAVALTELDPDGLSDYAKNADAFIAQVEALSADAQRLADEGAEWHAVMTEPAPQYLLDRVGAHNVTPAAFTRAVEGGFDIPPAALLEVLQHLESGEVDVVLWNEQTSGPQLEKVVDTAREGGIPVVSVTETLPPGMDFVAWMAANLRALEGALAP